MSYCAYITTISNISKHSNADRLQIVEVFGLHVIVDNSYYKGQRVVYFPVDGQLDLGFADENNLIRKKDENGNNIGGYMDTNKRNITAIKLRGEKSEGLLLPIESLSKYTDITKLNDGDTITVLGDVEICKKYIPRTNRRTRGGNGKNGKRGKKHHVDVAPLFERHVETEQLAYHLSDFYVGDHIQITLKLHGTSQRTGYLPVLQGYKRTVLDKLFRRNGNPIYEYGYVHGTRRTILDNFDSGYYGNDSFRKSSAEFFEGKLHKGETVYYEVVGYVNETTPIMPSGNNKKVGKDFVKQYGDTTTFNYSCGKGQSDFYVYRMTMTNEDGDVFEYSPHQIKYRCEQMGCKYVPVFMESFIPNDTIVGAGEWVKRCAEEYYDGADPIGKNHIREGVVIRIVNRPKFTAYKHKNFNFKLLAGIITDNLKDSQLENMSEDLLSEI